MFTSLKKMILQNRKRRVREKNRALVRFFLFLLETKSNVIRICTNERMVVYVFCDDINCFFIRSLSRNSDCRGATVLATGYATVWVALVIHAIVLIVRMGTIQSKVVPIIAIFLTCFTWIPILGWGIHLCIAILYFIDLLLGKYSIRRL